MQSVQPAQPLARVEGAGVAWRSLGLLIGLAAVIVVGLLSLRIGSIDISTRDAWDALFNYNSDIYNQTVVRTLRLPRTVIALAVGAALTIAGTTMQGVTRNPLADPSILGVSSGATFAVVTVTYYLHLSAPSQYVWFAFAGALAASLLVFAIGSTGNDGASPIKLALAGVVLSAFLGSWTSALLLLDENTLDTVRFWLAGSVVGRDLSTFWTLSPFLIGGSVVLLFLGHQLNVLDLGEDSARALGMQTGRIRLICSVLVVIVVGSAVSIAGPIAFVGLATPHIVRSIIGPDYRWVLPYSALAGALLLTVADISGRVLLRPAEIQVGIMTAMVGAPFLIYLARRTVMERG